MKIKFPVLLLKGLNLLLFTVCLSHLLCIYILSNALRPLSWMQKPLGLLSLLDEESTFPNANFLNDALLKLTYSELHIQ